ncbi:CoB--CoM heterodisulfide reductase iron-sulfur subunit A family protein [Desulfobacterales bacterium HSG2]|nr:CoB--CoM heterodisulfide reductase iron-sulfur subunit A family protein [Desulfobacterales bacterium HSG2]
MRIGVFVCHCGSNIAGTVDCEAVTQYAAALPDVVCAVNNLYTCSESGIAEIQKAVEAHDLSRVVVASCSPRTHQPLFQSSCAQAGLNPYLFEMVNIRDQCSWVHAQKKEEATEKAKDLVRMGVAKSRFLEPQEDIKAPLIPRTLVIGGGTAGLSAAEALADMGLEVVLVEKAPEPGGLLRQINRLAPEGDRAADRISALVETVMAKSNITVYTDSEVESVGGYIGSFEVAVRQKEGETLTEKVGCIVVASGAVPLQPKGMYNYDGKTVITQMELEEQLGSGSYAGRQVVMIQCVGARSPEREYCSRLCCMTAVKNALLIKEQDPDAQVHILYRDMQMYGTELEQMLWDARGQGVRFEVYDAEQPPTVESDIIRFYHPLMGENREIAYDLLVLSTPLVAREDAPALSQLMRVPVDQNGFFLEAHAKLRPLDFATDGIFVCGSARYPATVAEARAQGLGAASRVASILFKGERVIDAIVAEINSETCVGCMGCSDMCPFGAISYLPEQNICEVNMILCKGCGNCAATCPSQSAQLRGFKPQQILAQIRAV